MMAIRLSRGVCALMRSQVTLENVGFQENTFQAMPGVNLYPVAIMLHSWAPEPFYCQTQGGSEVSSL